MPTFVFSGPVSGPSPARRASCRFRRPHWAGTVIHALLAISCMPAFADVFTVGGGGTHASIQSAIDTAAANQGNHEIRVRQGFHAERLQINVSPGSLDISGGWNSGFTSQNLDLWNTQVSASLSGRPLTITGGSGSLRIAGMAFTGGLGVDADGGGVSIRMLGPSSVTLDTISIAFNSLQALPGRTAMGTGLYAQILNSAQLVVSGCFVHRNNTTLSSSPATAAIALVSGFGAQIRLADCEVSENAVATGGLDYAVGIFGAAAGGQIEIEHNRIVDHPAPFPDQRAVDLVVAGEQPIRFERNTVIGNGEAVQVHISAVAAIAPPIVIRNNLIAFGGAGISGNGGSVLSDVSFNTIVGNTRFGLGNSPWMDWNNNIVFGNGIDSLIPPSLPKSNLVGIDPRFVDPANQDFRLAADSPARDVAVAVPGFTPPNVDLDGFPRPSGVNHDVGAYEFDADSVFANGFD